MYPLLTLTQWLSPAYPVGAFTYSHGLEHAIDAGEIADANTAKNWISDCLQYGAARNDAILLAHAYSANEPADIADFARALATSRERLMESEEQGRAFARTTSKVWGLALPDMPYPVAIGYAAGMQKLPLETTLLLYIQAFAANLVSVAVRYVPLGQTDGQAITRGLQSTIASLAKFAVTSTLDDIGACAIRSDISSMKHETQTTRLFKS